MMKASSELALRIRVSADEADAIGLLDDDWDELVRAQARPNPTMLGGWIAAMSEPEFGRLTVVRLERDGRLVAAAAVSIFSPVGPLGPRFARWPGAPTSWFDPDILVGPEDIGVGAALVREILRHVHALYVPCVADSALARTLRDWNSRAVHRSPPSEGWIAPIPLPRDSYVRGHIAKDIRQAKRKGAVIEMRVATSDAEIDSALERLFAVHHGHWSARQDFLPRFSATEDLRARNRRAVLALAKTQESFIVEVLENGEVAAAGIGLLAGQGLAYHTTAARRGTSLREPGHACALEVVDQAAARGATVVDLGPGAAGPSSIKARIGANGVPIHPVMCAQSAALLRACQTLVTARERSRQAVRLLRGSRT